MRCPVDNETLMMTDRNGVEIDYCPKCRGVWLDRGELDKIIERAGVGAAAPAAAATPAAPPPPRPAAPYPAPSQSAPPPYYRRDDDDDDDRYRYGPGQSGEHYRKKKRKDFLSDLFDF